MGSVIVTAIANGITIALVPLFLVWAARKFPSRQLQQEGPSLEELAPRYKWWDAGFTVLYMLLWIPATAAIFLPLYYLDKWRIERMHVGDDTFAFNAGALLLLPALLGAIVAAIFPLLLIQRLVLGKRNVEYDRYVELKHRIDPVRLLRLLSLVVGAAVVAMTLGFMGWYVIPARDKVIVNPLFGFERTYAYSDVADAETAPILG